MAKILETIGKSILKPNSITALTAKLKLFGAANPNRFKVHILPPVAGRRELTFAINSQFVSFSCINAVLPGKNFLSSERKIKGPFTKIPYAKAYENVTLSFLVSQNMQEKTFFNAWQDLIMDEETHELNYYDEYVSTIRIQQLDKSLNSIYEVELKEAYPVSISALTLDAASQNEIHKLDVTFAYYKWVDIAFSNFLPLPIKIPNYSGIVDAISGITNLTTGHSINTINLVSTIKSKVGSIL